MKTKPCFIRAENFVCYTFYFPFIIIVNDNILILKTQNKHITKIQKSEFKVYNHALYLHYIITFFNAALG